MRRIRSLSALLVIALAASFLAAVAGPATPALADTNATTDDSSVSAITGSWVYSNVTTAQVGTYLNNNRARLTDIEPYSTSGNTWTVTMVRNSGSYAVPGWWWYVDITAAQISSFLSANNGRLIDIEAYVDGGTLKYAVVMVSNTGTAARGWTYLIGVTGAQITSNINNNNQRIIDIERYTVGRSTMFAAVFVTNSGTDAKAWEWWTGQSLAAMAAKVTNFGGRVIDVERDAGGNYTFVQVKNSGADGKYFQYLFGLSLTSVVQVLTQYGLRAVDLDVYFEGTTAKYNLIGIDNVDPETRRLNAIIAPSLTKSNGLPAATWGFYVRPMGSATPIASLQAATKFEPASAIKAVHNLAVVRKIRAGLDSMTANNFIYYTYNGGGSNTCPTPELETAAGRKTVTVDSGKGMMMEVSDNRTTRGVVLRYGFPYVQQTAAFAGMTNTTIKQDFIGCAFKDGKKNQTTLVDLAKLYEGVQNGTLVGTGVDRSNFFRFMNGQLFLTDNSLESKVINIVRAEAAAQGKQAVANAFVDKMRWNHKGGSYNTKCKQPLTVCSEGRYQIRSFSGLFHLPFKTGSTYVQKTYLNGTYFDALNTECAGCLSVPSDDVQQSLIAESMRSAIRDALRSW